MKKIIRSMIVVTGVVSVLLVASCALTAKRGQLAEPYPVWPSYPAETKIELVSVFSQPGDLNIGKGFWQQISEFFLGNYIEDMVRPMAVVVRNEQQIYVADPGVHGVHLFDLKEQDYKLIKLPEHREMLSPIALALSGTKDVLITDSKQAVVYLYHYGDEFASVLELEEGLEQPTGILVDEITEDIYIVDTKRHQILVYDATGSLINVIGKRGTGNGEFNFPTMISWNSAGQILVTDSLNFRIQLLKKSGQYIKQFGKIGDATGYQARPKGIASDYQDNIYVVDSLFNTVQIFDSSGRYLLSVGERGQAPGQFWLPSGIFIGDGQKIYIADSYNQRVQVLQLMKAVR